MGLILVVVISAGMAENSQNASFWRTKAVVTSYFAVGTLTDFLAKAQLLDRDVNFMSLIA